MTEIDDYSALVLDVVDSIPAGQVMSYGDIAEYLGAGGPRQVGRVLSRYGGGAPWWRVTRADGKPPAGHEARALARYLEEGTPLLSPRRPGALAVAPGALTSGPGALTSSAGARAAGTGARAAGVDGQRGAAPVRVDMRRARWNGPVPADCPR